jgi:hypothetical protein
VSLFPPEAPLALLLPPRAAHIDAIGQVDGE